MLRRDAPGHVKAQAAARAQGLGGEEGLHYVRYHLGADSRAVILPANYQAVCAALEAPCQFPAAGGKGGQGVVKQIGPDLVEAGGQTHHQRQVGA
ncbi:hypothetical protein [Hymenobacter fodinae]|uniref:hypothetical protein n=1 Tax=Hymenobacter fodinae TaxID=2510796 RepID=UPI0014367B99|nr:hypothetical protein [Hymenobacter fodinae]